MPVALLSDIVIISIIVIITLMIYRDMTFLLSPIPIATYIILKYELMIIIHRKRELKKFLEISEADSGGYSSSSRKHERMDVLT